MGNRIWKVLLSWMLTLASDLVGSSLIGVTLLRMEWRLTDDGTFIME
jgi:hypothetical protein